MKDALALLLVFLFVGGLMAFVCFLVWYEPWLLLLFVGLPAALVSFIWAVGHLDGVFK